MKTDYPELEGKEVTYRFRYRTVTGVVAGVNYHVGISIVAKENKERFLLCLSYKQQHKTKFSTPADYLQAFRKIVKMIEAGIIVSSEIDKLSYTRKLVEHLSNRAASAKLAPCPFRQ